MNCKFVSPLFLSALVSGMTVLGISSVATAQSANTCERYLSGMNVFGSDFYARMSAYQNCASQWINNLPKQPPQNYRRTSQPQYNPYNSNVYSTINDGYWNHGYGRMLDTMWNGGIPRSTKPPTYYGR